MEKSIHSVRSLSLVHPLTSLDRLSRSPIELQTKSLPCEARIFLFKLKIETESANMFTIPTGSQTSSIAEFNQSDYIDFSVWALIQCGLHHPPFDQHRLRSNTLQFPEIEKTFWIKWFRKLVTSQHASILIRCDEATYAVEQRNKLAFSPLVTNGDMGLILSFSKSSEALLKKYRDSIVRLSHFDSALVEEKLSSLVHNPVDLWEGSEESRASLENLWLSYKATPNCRVYHGLDFYRHIVRNRIHSLAKDLNDDLGDILEGQEVFLMIQLINYCADVSVIAGSSIVIGLNRNKPFSPEVFREQVTAAARAFVKTRGLVGIEASL